jgi:mono/diheme cytochrome c family protein
MTRAVLRIVAALGAVAWIGIPTLATVNAASTDEVVRAVVPLNSKAAPTTVLGSLMPGASVAVGAPGTPAAITLTAWYSGTSSALLVTKPGERIVVARLTPAGVTAEAPGATQTDAYGTTWHAVSIEGLVDPAQLVPDETTVFHDAAALYGTHCSSCHALHQPSEFTANQWPAILSSMQRNGALSGDQAALVLAYLQRNAKTP